jgi:hypothetical protein
MMIKKETLISLFTFGGTNANRKFNLFREPGLRIKDAQDAFCYKRRTGRIFTKLENFVL